MRSGSGQAAPSAPQTSPDQGGGLIDILRQVFGQGPAESAGPTASPVPSGPPPSSTDGGSLGDQLGPGRNYRIPTGGQPSPIPTDPGGQAIPSGDVFGQILTELGKAIQDGRLKPVVIATDTQNSFATQSPQKQTCGESAQRVRYLPLAD